MKYPRLNELIPEGEHFDESAVNEGVWLTVTHLNNIEESLSQSTTAIEAVENNLAVANNNISELEKTVNDLQKSVNDANQTITKNNSTIAALQAKITELGGQSSGNGTTLLIQQDEAESSKEPSYLDDNNPINSWADKKLRKK